MRRKNRRWFQFSFAGLAVATTICCAALALVVRHRQARYEDIIRAMQGTWDLDTINIQGSAITGLDLAFTFNGLKVTTSDPGGGEVEMRIDVHQQPMQCEFQDNTEPLQKGIFRFRSYNQLQIAISQEASGRPDAFAGPGCCLLQLTRRDARPDAPTPGESGGRPMALNWSPLQRVLRRIESFK